MQSLWRPDLCRQRLGKGPRNQTSREIISSAVSLATGRPVKECRAGTLTSGRRATQQATPAAERLALFHHFDFHFSSFHDLVDVRHRMPAPAVFFKCFSLIFPHFFGVFIDKRRRVGGAGGRLVTKSPSREVSYVFSL